MSAKHHRQPKSQLQSQSQHRAACRYKFSDCNPDPTLPVMTAVPRNRRTNRRGECCEQLELREYVADVSERTGVDLSKELE